MTWICVCGHENNLDVTECSECKKSIPDYKGINIISKELGFSKESTGAYYAQVGYQYFLSADELLDKILDLRDQKEIDEVVAKINFLCDSSFSMLNKAKVINFESTIEDQDGIERSVDSLLASVHFCIGILNRKIGVVSRALEHLKKSYELEQTQMVLYFLAVVISENPVEDIGGFIKGKKLDVAWEQMRKIELDMLRQAIKYDPTSAIGIRCAQRIFEKYQTDDFGLGDYNS